MRLAPCFTLRKGSDFGVPFSSGAFSGVNVVRDERAGRFFRNRVDEATRLLGAQVDRLRNPAEGPTAALQYIVNARKNPDIVFEEPSKRLKGQAYAEEKKRQEMIKKHGLKVSSFFSS